MRVDKTTDSQQALAAEIGKRQLAGKWKLLIPLLCVLWSLFQLWISSPLPYWLGAGILNNTESRSIHLTFALLIAFLAFPFSATSAKNKLPVMDIVLALLASFSASYLFFFYHPLSLRPGNPNLLDLSVALMGLLLLLEAVRRSVGWPLAIIALLALCYTVWGPWMPSLLSHKGASLNRLASHQWLTTEGVFGIPLGVSSSFVFLFVLFGALLEKAGAGKYFIDIAFALVGDLTGGPAKASVLASGMTGIASGSSIANVVTTGTFTIPLMKKIGYPGYKSGAIEVAASTNGQLMPPVMGAAAFLIVEYVNIPYNELMKHALMPAVISYIGLLAVVHIEAVKLKLQRLQRQQHSFWYWRFLFLLITLCSAVLIVILLSSFLSFIAAVSKPYDFQVIMTILLLIYLLSLYVAVKNQGGHQPSLEYVPELKKVLPTGIHFILPIAVLLWCLLIMQLSPGLSAYYGTLSIIVVLLTQKPLQALMLGQWNWAEIRNAIKILFAALEMGSRNMVGIAIATAAAGVVVGAVSLTGVGQALTEFIEVISFGSVFLMLLITAITCMLLGMGLPTTANYIVVSTLIAPVIVALSSSQGFIIPLIAVHLFVFYFGIMADDTPPVGLAAFAAAGIADSNPFRTGIQSFTYDLRTAILPFMFVYNTEILLIGIDSLWQGILVFVSATVAMLLFVAVIQGYFFGKIGLYKRLLLLGMALLLFVPTTLLNKIFPPYQQIAVTEIEQVLFSSSYKGEVRLHVRTETDLGVRNRVYLFNTAEKDFPHSAAELGLQFERRNQDLWITEVQWLSIAEQRGLSADYEHKVTALTVKVPQPSPYWITCAVLLMVFIRVFVTIRCAPI